MAIWISASNVPSYPSVEQMKLMTEPSFEKQALEEKI